MKLDDYTKRRIIRHLEGAVRYYNVRLTLLDEGDVERVKLQNAADDAIRLITIMKLAE